MTAAPAPRQRQHVSVLQLWLHEQRLGHLVQTGSGATALVFDRAFVADKQRPTFTLSLLPSHPAAAALLAKPWLREQGLHPVLANLLPEGATRAWLQQQLGTSDDFSLLAALGQDLGGALRALPLALDAIPPGVLDFNASVLAPPPPVSAAAGATSLAGSQPKLSLVREGERWQLAAPGSSGRWLLKLPSTLADGLPQNEFTALTLAQLAGVDVPAFELLPLHDLSAPAGMAWQADAVGLAVARFDRSDDGTRIHCEDFAQVLFKLPHEKYSLCDAALLGQLMHGFTAAPQTNALQLARRLLVNVLLGNGDAHLKNWSVLYRDQHHAQLAPAYDLQCTALQGDVQMQRWRIGDCDDWYALEFSHFEQWGRAVGLPWRALKPVLKDTVERARTLWPAALETLPMLETHKLLLRHHWKSLTKKLQYGL